MFLKSLELNGFKSFAEKTSLEFPKGITAIVGPNGSGKSNIIDAIRWILGERDPKILRGAKAEDLIWNGSPRRPRMGAAQASLHLDNQSGFFPMDVSEVALARRVDREGISAYLLNKAEVRLKDIVDFLSRARLGTKGLIIIGQGLSDLFVRVSGEERRVMIEEILGLREFQLKKAEAERKLKTTFFNLEKVRAMIEEVLPRLRLLKRQTAKWEKREAIAAELRSLENIYFGSALKESDEAFSRFQVSQAALDESYKVKESELGRLEEKLKEIEKKGDTQTAWKEIQKKKAHLAEERRSLERSLMRLDVALEAPDKNTAGKKTAEELLLLIREIRALLQELDSTEDLKIVQSGIRRAIRRIEEVTEKNRPDEPRNKESSEEKVNPHTIHPQMSGVGVNLTAKMHAVEKAIGELEKEEEGIASGLQDFNRLFKEAFNAVEEKKEEMRRIENEKNRLAFEREKIELKLDELKREADQAGRRLEEFRHTAKAEESPPDTLRRMFKLRSDLAAIGEIDEALIKEAKEVEKHYEFLTAQSKDLEAAAADLKTMARELGEKIHAEFSESIKKINEKFSHFFRLMFGGGHAKLRIKNYELRIKSIETEDGEEEEKRKNRKKAAGNQENGEEQEIKTGIEIELNLPKKRITNLDMLSGGEKSLVSIAALFALISVSPPPFLVLDEIDAPLDESNSKRFADLIRDFSKNTQFVVVTHNRATMESADVLYGITMGDDGCSKVLSVKLEGVAAK